MNFKKQLKLLDKQTWIFGMLSFIILLLSCAKNSEEMNLKGVLDYKWNTSIEAVEKDFNKKKYSEITISKAETRKAEIEKRVSDYIASYSKYNYDDAKDIISNRIASMYDYTDIVSDYISAKMTYNDLPASIEIHYFNKQIFYGTITIDELKEDKVPEIKEKIILEFKKKYGEPQETEENTIWKFRDNFSLGIGSFCYETQCNVYIGFLNNDLSKEKWSANKQKIEEIKEKRRLAEEEKQKKEEAERLQWLEDNKEKVKEKLKGKLTISSDEFTGAKWINSTHKKIGSLLEKLYLYIAITGKSKYVSLRMVINHTSASNDRWLNISNEYKFNIDGERKTLEPKSDEKINFNYGYKNYYESFDVNVNDDENRITLLKDIADSKKTIIRFQGERYYEDREISEKEKEGIETIFLAYEYLKKGGSLKDIL